MTLPFENRLCLLILFIFPSGVYAQPSDPASPTVEVVIDGKEYVSVHAYQRERLKAKLKTVLIPTDWREFNDQELCAIIQELSQSKNAADPAREPAGNDMPAKPMEVRKMPPVLGDEENAVHEQMQEMLRDFLATHDDVRPVDVDPAKVKTILIQPKSDPGHDEPQMKK